MWRKIAANTVYQLGGKGFSILANILILALVTRSLGVAQFGEYILVTTVPTFLYLLGDFGLNAVFLREVARNNHHVDKFGSLLSLRMLLAAISVLLGLAYAFLYPHAPLVRLGIILALTTVFTQGVFVSLNALFQHNLRYDLSVLAGIFAHVVAAALVVWGFFNRAGFMFFVLTWVATYFSVTFLALILSRKIAERPRFSWDPEWIRQIFRATLPIGLMLVFSQVSWMADVFLLRALDSAEAVGIYRLGYKVFENILPIPIFFVNALYPVMLQDHKQSLVALWGRLSRGIWILLVSALVLAALGLAAAPVLISILGGADFGDSILVLRVLVISLPVFFLTAPLQWFLITVGKERVLPLIYAAAAVLNVWVNFSFIPKYSYFASLFATIAAEILILSLLLFQVIRFKRGTVKARS
uniref:Flippase n=1 Tax=candidate division WWE3 bacterium TaxID=2053526 RepID=A0A831Z1Z2_UNCKA